MEYVRIGPQLPQKNPDIILWHYTSPEVFWKMLRGELYATHYRYLNDSAEILYGINASKEQFANAKNHLPYADNIIKYVERKDFFLLCFSEDADSLYQWRAYAPSGGFSIGFSYNSLAKILSNYECSGADKTYFEFNLLKCKYVSQENIKRYIKLCAYTLESAKEVLCEECGLSVLNDSFDNETDDSMRFDGDFHKKVDKKTEDIINASSQYRSDVFNAYTLLKTLQKRCSSFKNPSFRFEKEHRLTITGEQLRPYIELIGGKPRIKIDLPNLQRCITSVFISPHGDVQQNNLLAEIARDKFGLNFEICQSKSSFNGK